MSEAYLSEATTTARRAMAEWHREPAANSFGSFDRQYWAWKKKDLSDATLVAAIALCIRLAEHEKAAHALPALTSGVVEHLESIQHGNGSFDQIYPYERAPGVFYDILTPLLDLLQSRHLTADAGGRLERVIRRGLAYAMATDESHGEIANHFAHYAWELIHAGQVFKDDSISARGRAYLERTLALQHLSEGWFREYDGADAGYQSRNLSFLTRIAELTGDTALWSRCEAGARFVDRLLMPDDSLHPMFGVRSTALIYPAGLERLATRNPAFAPLADRIHAGWESGTTPIPSRLDFENALRLADDAFAAATIRTARSGAATPVVTAFEPYDLEEAGLHRRVISLPAGGTAVLAIGSSLGGVVATYAPTADGGWQLCDEDSGYLLTLNDGSRWVSRRSGAGRIVERDTNGMTLGVTFERSRHDDLTPLRMIILRVLNLTVLRTQAIGDLFKRIVVRRLISGRETIPLRMTRRLDWSGGKVRVEDTFSADPAFAKRLAGAKLQRCRRLIGNHMASSRYFQPAELTLSRPWIEDVSVESLAAATVRTSLSVHP